MTDVLEIGTIAALDAAFEGFVGAGSAGVVLAFVTNGIRFVARFPKRVLHTDGSNCPLQEVAARSCGRCRDALELWLAAPPRHAPAAVVVRSSAVLRSLCERTCAETSAGWVWQALDEASLLDAENRPEGCWIAGESQAHLQCPSVLAVPRPLGSDLHELQWVVELKPKWGTRPQIKTVSLRDEGSAGIHVVAALPDVKRRHERFELMQATKGARSAAKGKSFQKSAFSPEALFAAETPEDMFRQLHALAATPQNNWQVKRPLHAAKDATEQRLTETEMQVLASVLVVDPLLAVLRQLQQFAGGNEGGGRVLDVEHLALIHQVWNEHRTKAMNAEAPSRRLLLQCDDEPPEHLTASRVEQLVDDFYVATVARDVSVLVRCWALRQPTARMEDSADSSGSDAGAVWRRMAHPQWLSGSWWCVAGQREDMIACVSVIDIDSKRHKPVQTYLEKDRAIVAEFERM
jgi:hypothetical protein